MIDVYTVLFITMIIPTITVGIVTLFRKGNVPEKDYIDILKDKLTTL